VQRGRFIALEGIDGTGKSTQCALLVEWLRARGRDVVATREPTDGPWGRRYRAWARGEFECAPDQVLEYFVRDRREHVDALIAPALARGADVVCDRYVASTLAYQAADGVDPERLRKRLAREDFPVPDLTLWLRVPAAVALARLGPGAVERYERAEAFLARVDAQYARLGLVEIDARGPVERVQAELRRRVEPLLSR
jgi:dTMP kinase